MYQCGIMDHTMRAYTTSLDLDKEVMSVYFRKFTNFSFCLFPLKSCSLHPQFKHAIEFQINSLLFIRWLAYPKMRWLLTMINLVFSIFVASQVLLAPNTKSNVERNLLTVLFSFFGDLLWSVLQITYYYVSDLVCTYLFYVIACRLFAGLCKIMKNKARMFAAFKVLICKLQSNVHRARGIMPMVQVRIKEVKLDGAKCM